MIATILDVFIYCDLCKQNEHKRDCNNKEEYLKRRVIPLTHEQKNDKEYIKKILFDRELGLKMLPEHYMQGDITIDLPAYKSADNKIPNNIFFSIDDRIHICHNCADAFASKTETL